MGSTTSKIFSVLEQSLTLLIMFLLRYIVKVDARRRRTHKSNSIKQRRRPLDQPQKQINRLTTVLCNFDADLSFEAPVHRHRASFKRAMPRPLKLFWSQVVCKPLTKLSPHITNNSGINIIIFPALLFAELFKHYPYCKNFQRLWPRF